MDPRAEALAGKRLRYFARGCVLWGVILLLRLIHLQIIDHSKYVKSAESQQVRTVKVKAPRGALFDRTGEVLAVSVEAESVVVNPIRIPNPAFAADLLAGQLNLPAAELRQKIEQSKARRNGFLYVKRRISSDEAERLRSYKLDWVEFRKESIRVYPKDQRAAHVLGSVDAEEQGNNGLERSLN
ncbi:MAG TPA: hypothetical protein VER03_11990, partial [Bryobacteraceae bacterium]|nr:hypothetical protein [Bryobacteraceae bacterium]